MGDQVNTNDELELSDEESENNKPVTIKKLAMNIIKDKGWPEDYYKLIPDRLKSMTLDSRRSYDLDDEIDDVRTIVKTVQSLITKTITNETVLETMLVEQNNIADFFGELSNKAYYFKD